MKDRRDMIVRMGIEGVERRRQMGFEVSEAHSPSHLRNVAELTQKVGSLYLFTGRELELAYDSGWFHDMVRSSTEDPGVGDEGVSAREARRLLVGAGLVTEEEGGAIAYAIARQGQYPEWWSDPETREIMPQELERKLHFVLFVADKMEANGVRVIARRSQFVAGDRLRGEKGDWRNFGFQPDKDEALVVAIESLLRLAFINPEEIYPLRLKPIVGPLYEVQREFVLGLFRGIQGMGINAPSEHIARLLLRIKNREGKNILQVRKIAAPESVSELVEVLAVKSGITNEKVDSTPAGWAVSSLETVGYFSQRYQEDLDDLVKKWNPAGEKAREWRQSMIDYMEGKI